MNSKILILTARNLENESYKIDYSQIGLQVKEISHLYQLCKESLISLVLVDESRLDFKKSVANKIRRCNSMSEIWELTDDIDIERTENDFFDGVISKSLEAKGTIEKVESILLGKELLNKYHIISNSAKMKAVAQTINRVAATDITVLIEGPSGSGKELIARAIHDNSKRHDQPFVTVNCGAIAEGILESELFGHEKGAFTGSVGKRDGLFQRASSGTIFLDEIGETKPDMQVKLLRVLEDGTYYPVGSSEAQKSSARVVAATNLDLIEEIKDKRFREDLYFRIGVVKIVLPALYERKGDILPLLRHFLPDLKETSYSDRALEMLVRYDWPGNVRQLKNFADRIKALKPNSKIDENDVETFLMEQHSSAKNLPVATGKTVDEAGQELIYRAILSLGTEIKLLRDLITSHLPGEIQGDRYGSADFAGDSGSTMEEMEKMLVEKALEDSGGNRKEAARKLGIGERTLYRKISKYNLR